VLLADIGGGTDAVRRVVRAQTGRVGERDEADGHGLHRCERGHDMALGPHHVCAPSLVLEEQPDALCELAAGAAERLLVLDKARDEDGLAVRPAAGRADEPRSRRVDPQDLRGLGRCCIVHPRSARV
jgi:hypothetical protein